MTICETLKPHFKYRWHKVKTPWILNATYTGFGAVVHSGQHVFRESFVYFAMWPWPHPNFYEIWCCHHILKEGLIFKSNEFPHLCCFQLLDVCFYLHFTKNPNFLGNVYVMHLTFVHECLFFSRYFWIQSQNLYSMFFFSTYSRQIQ